MPLSRTTAIALLVLSLLACTRQEAGGSATPPGAQRAASPSAGPQAAPSRVGDPHGAAPGLACAKAATTTEKAICADPALVALDRELAAAWTAALARTYDRDALLADQRAWLAQRAACMDLEGARGCLRSQYAVRNAILRAVDAGPFAWAGRWTRVRGEAQLTLTPVAGSGDFTFALDAASGGHTGVAEGRARPAGDRMLRASAADPAGEACRLELRRIAGQIEVVEIDSAFDCGAAMGVTFAGRYMREGGRARGVEARGVEYSLLTLDLVDTAAQDDRIRALLGETGYAALVERCQMVSRDAQAPGLATCGVRGLYTIMEAAVQQQGDTVRIAMIVDDEVRYWSDDAATRSAPPAWFDTWRERFADKPVRLMSVPGTPRLPAGSRGR